MAPASKSAMTELRKETCHNNAELVKQEIFVGSGKQKNDSVEHPTEQTSSPKIVLNNDGSLNVVTPSKNNFRKKSWSPRFLSKGKCSEEISSEKSIGNSFELPSSPDIAQGENGLLSVKSPPRENALKKWSPRLLRKAKCHEEISSSKQFTVSSSEHPSRPGIVQCDDDLLSVKPPPSENALKKWSPRFLRKLYDISELNEEEISVGGLTGSGSAIESLGGSKHRRNAFCAMLVTVEYFKAIPYLELLSTLSGTDLI